MFRDILKNDGLNLAGNALGILRTFDTRGNYAPWVAHTVKGGSEPSFAKTVGSLPHATTSQRNQNAGRQAGGGTPTGLAGRSPLPYYGSNRITR